MAAISAKEFFLVKLVFATREAHAERGPRA